MNETKTELKLIHMEDVISKEVSWLWYPYIPFGKITVIEGDPGEGKTTLILKIAAFAPLIEEFSNTVEQKKDIEAGNSFRGLFTPLGELLISFKEKLRDGVCWFPRLMRWKTSKGEVSPVFTDFKNEGYNYRLKSYANVITKEEYTVERIQPEIRAENRIGTLEQLVENIEVVEQQSKVLQEQVKRQCRR